MVTQKHGRHLQACLQAANKQQAQQVRVYTTKVQFFLFLKQESFEVATPPQNRRAPLACDKHQRRRLASVRGL